MTDQPIVVRNRDELRQLIADHGALRLKYDGGRLPLLDSRYRIVGYLGGDMTANDLDGLDEP